MSKHTPGPWQTGREDMQSYDGATGEPFSSVYANDPRGKMHMGSRLPLVVARMPGGEVDREEEKANARLIASAPDLLTACKALVEYQESTDLDDEPEDGEYGDGKRAMLAARAAIAKAEGRTK